MERNLIAWTLPNWITIVLMVVLGYVVFAVVTQLGMKAIGKNETVAVQGTY